MPRTFMAHLAAGLWLAFAGQAQAHDFWVQPDAYSPACGLTALTLQVGHGPDRQRSGIAQSRVLRFEALAPDGSTLDLRPGMHFGAPGSDAEIRLPAPGTWLLAFQTDAAAQSRLPAGRYNAYLRDEGLTPALLQRQAAGRTEAEGSENYRRVSKVIVRVGASASSAAGLTRPLGLPLEIVPERDPAAAAAGAMPVQVWFEGALLPGALVKLTDLDHDAAPVAMAVTDAGGRASFGAPGAGRWLLNVVWTKAQAPTADTEFETTFSSLSFEIGGERRR